MLRGGTPGHRGVPSRILLLNLVVSLDNSSAISLKRCLSSPCNAQFQSSATSPPRTVLLSGMEHLRSVNDHRQGSMAVGCATSRVPLHNATFHATHADDTCRANALTLVTMTPLPGLGWRLTEPTIKTAASHVRQTYDIAVRKYVYTGSTIFECTRVVCCKQETNLRRASRATPLCTKSRSCSSTIRRCASLRSCHCLSFSAWNPSYKARLCPNRSDSLDPNRASRISSLRQAAFDHGALAEGCSCCAVSIANAVHPDCCKRRRKTETCS